MSKHDKPLEDISRQHCSVCECVDKFSFHIPDHTWRKVVPEKLQNSVVCLQCFDDFASEKNINYSEDLDELWFAGDKASVKFDVTAAKDL